MDINPTCKQFEEERIKIFIGSQSSRKFLRQLKQELPPIDILIDDGGHTMEQQIITFEELFDKVKEDGVFLCEDLHTSYWKNAGGGLRRKGTFIEYSKSFIDYLNAWHSEQFYFRENSLTHAVWSISYYGSIIVIEKRPMEHPKDFKSGKNSFNADLPAKNFNFYFAFLLKFIKDNIIEGIFALLRLPSPFYGSRTFFRWRLKK